MSRGVTARPVPMPPSPEPQGDLCPLLSVLFSSHMIFSLDSMFILENSPHPSLFVARTPHLWSYPSELSRGLSSPGLPAEGIITNAQWHGDGDSVAFPIPHLGRR